MFKVLPMDKKKYLKQIKFRLLKTVKLGVTLFII
jgi:hypothetical protein